MEALLNHTLESLIVSDDNMAKLEVLVINDGSKDSSLAIAREFETKYPDTFHAVDKPNGNYGSCVNRGMIEATGKYVKVLDADDFFDTRRFDSLISFLSNVDVDLVLSDFDVVNDHSVVEASFTFDLPTDRNFTLKEIPKDMTEWLWHQAITYKTEIVRSIGYKQTEGISYTDDEWVYKPMMNVSTVMYYPHSVYKYLRGREGQTFDPKVIKKTLKQRVTVAKSMVDYYVTNKPRFNADVYPFMEYKLFLRLRTLYHYHLLRYKSAESVEQIVEFDFYLKEKAADLYDLLNELKNNYGWHYLRQWRRMGHKPWAPALNFIRIKRKIQEKLKNQTVRIDEMPKSLKRKE